jgi:hypothetical protein
MDDGWLVENKGGGKNGQAAGEEEKGETMDRDRPKTREKKEEEGGKEGGREGGGAPDQYSTIFCLFQSKSKMIIVEHISDQEKEIF